MCNKKLDFHNEELPFPKWQKIELDKRYSEYKDRKLNLHNYKDVHLELKIKYFNFLKS